MGIVYSFSGTKYSRMDQLKFVEASPGFPQVLESPGKSWDLKSVVESSGKLLDLLIFMKNPGKVLEFYTISVR